MKKEIGVSVEWQVTDTHRPSFFPHETHCVIQQGFSSSSLEVEWKSWLRRGRVVWGWGGAQDGGWKKGCGVRCGVQGCGRWRQGAEGWVVYTKAHIWNIQFSNDQLLPFSNLDWIILYGKAIIPGIITCSPGDLVYSFCLLLTVTGAVPGEQPAELISDNPWFTSSSPPTPPWYSSKST